MGIFVFQMLSSPLLKKDKAYKMHFFDYEFHPFLNILVSSFG